MGKANKKGKGQGEVFDFARIDNLFLIASEKVDLPGHEFVSQENQDYFTFSEKSLYKIGNFFDVVGTKIYQWKRNAVLENEENHKVHLSIFKYDSTYIDWQIYLKSEQVFDIQEDAQYSDYITMFTMLMVEDFLIKKLKELEEGMLSSKYFKIKKDLEDTFANIGFETINDIKAIVGKNLFDNIAKEYYAIGKAQKKKVSDIPVGKRFKEFETRLDEKTRNQYLKGLVLGFNPTYYLNHDLFDALPKEARDRIIAKRLKKIKREGDDLKPAKGLYMDIFPNGYKISSDDCEK